MSDLSPTAAPLRPPRAIPATTLLAQGFRDVAARWPQALALGAAGAGWSIGLRLIRAAQPLPHPLWSPAGLGLTALSAVVTAALAALTLRLFLAPGPRWLRVDRGFWLCTGLLILAGLGISTSGWLTLRDFGSRGISGLELRLGLNVAAEVLLAWIYVRLLLWPIGALMAEPGLTPARSWALMRGQVAGFIVAVIVLEAPTFLLTTGYIFIAPLVVRVWPIGRPTWLWVATAVIGAAAQLVRHAMAAIIWREKTGHPGGTGVP